MATPSAAVFEEARALFGAGLAALKTGELQDAEAHLQASLRLLPGRPSTLINLAAARAGLGRTQAALETLDAALAIEPSAVDAWYQRGQFLQALARPQEALAAYDRALALDSTCGPAWSQRGGILKDLQRLEEAATCFRQALAHGADPVLNGYFLASAEAASGGTKVPTTAPRVYVEGLFDSYASEFDTHLLHELAYSGPQTLFDLLPPTQHFDAALDLGCGTGLMAPLLRQRVAQLDGVDLSSKMLEQAASKALYRQLHHADLSDHLTTCAQSYALVVAADVFIYVGDLASVFAGVRHVLDTGGLFAFSLETANADTGFALTASSRFVHSRPYIEGLCAQHGYSLAQWQNKPIRQEQGRSIAGAFVLLRSN